MINTLSQNYEQILKKLAQKAWKTGFYFILTISWGIIIIGTYFMLK
tara:strand:- start:1070 stop:1207 length:138 start_codon:yes stop_codon:yes gene_type:complete